MSRLLRSVAGAAAALLVAGSAFAQRPDPTDAVVFVRVFARVSAEIDEFGKRAERRDLEVATGTGFIVSPSGYVLTNHHVIHLESETITIDGREIEIRKTLERIEVVLASGQRLDATVFGSDPDMDLAVLAVAGAGLPYVPFGDSDAIEPGAGVTAHGFPFGRSLEVGRERTDAAVPQPTVTPGAVSAVRAGDDDERRFLQITNALNPGNSGGPVIDAEGYAVGVVVMRVTKGDSIGFAIAINRVKDFLENVGLDSALPSRRLALAASSPLAEKGLRIRMPHGYQDLLAGRLRVEAGDRPAGDPVLEVDRVFSRWTLEQMERGLLAGGEIVPGPPYEPDSQARRRAKAEVWGRASRVGPDGARRIMEYRLVSLGADWIVARYEGPADAMAFNRSVVKMSLASIDADPLFGPEVRPPRWISGRLEPVEWILEPGAGPHHCEQTRVPPGFAWTSPDHYAVSARYAVWEGVAEAALVAACRGAKTDGSYRLVSSRAGVGYVFLGYLLQREAGVAQIELHLPREYEAAAVEWLRQWRAALSAK
jgi:S1-C subfamily serine protease